MLDRILDDKRMCSKGCTKNLLIGLNAIFVVLGFAVIGAGLNEKYNKDSLAVRFSDLPTEIKSGENEVDVPSLVSIAATALITGGVFAFVVGIFGCCGAWREVTCFLFAYSIILVFLIITEVAFIGVIFATKNQIRAGLMNFLNFTIAEGYKGGTGFDKNGAFSLAKNAMTLAWDITQFKLHCCGITGFDDYKYAQEWDHAVRIAYEEFNATVPLACCKLKDPRAYPKRMKVEEFVNVEECLISPKSSTNVNGVGCYEAVTENFMQFVLLSGSMTVAIAVLEIGGLTCACWLYNHLKKGQNDKRNEKTGLQDL